MANWVWRSTETSRAEGKISILAFVETLFFVLLTWGVAFYYNFYYYLFAPLVLTPFLMLKTPKSIERSLFWFMNKQNVRNDRLFFSSWSWHVVFSMSFVSSVIVFILHKYFLTMNSFEAFWIGIVLGTFGLALSWFMRSLIIKVITTVYCFLEHPIYTFSYLPLNWHEQILVNDTFYSPELLPKIGENHKEFQLEGLIQYSRNTPFIYEKVLSLTGIIIWAIAYFYRWSIKATAWFYWPLAFVLNIQALENKVTRKTLIDDQTNPLMLKGNIVVGAILLIYFMGSIVSLDKLGNIESSVEVIVELFRSISINHPVVKTIIQPETWWLVVSATLIYFILFGFSSIQQHRRSHSNPEYSEMFNMILHWLIRLKNILWIAFFAINLFFIANQHMWPLIYNFV